MDGRMCVCLCMSLWMASQNQKNFLSSASLFSVRLSGEVSLCELLVVGLQTENEQRAVPMWIHVNLCEGLRPEVGVKRTKEVGQLSLRLGVWEDS